MGAWSSETKDLHQVSCFHTATFQLGFYIFNLKHTLYNKQKLPLKALWKSTTGKKYFKNSIQNTFLKIIIWYHRRVSSSTKQDNGPEGEDKLE